MKLPAKGPASPPRKGDAHYATKIHDGEPATAVPITAHHAPATPQATPYTVIPVDVASATTAHECTLWGLCCRTLKLIPFHILNFVVATVGFCVEVTGVSLAAGLLPVCLLGIPIYYGVLHVTRVLAVADVALANMITHASNTVRLDVPDEEDRLGYVDPHRHTSPHQRRLAPELTRISARSSVVVLYFATLKFALGIASLVVAALPLLPIASQIVASSTRADEPKYVAGWEVHKFNFDTHPVAYSFMCIGCLAGGVLLMHVFGTASRETTRYVCSTKPRWTVNSRA